MFIKRSFWVFALALVLVFSAGCGFFGGQISPAPTDASLTVTFLDVGQADCTLVQDHGKTLLIDAGTNDGAKKLVSTLRQKGVRKIDMLVGTHPHEDHIGGMDSVIQNFTIGAVFMPDVTNTTKTFNDVMVAISSKGLKISVPRPGDSFMLGQSAGTFLAPNSPKYEDLNDYSIVIRLQFENTSFLFTGDAQTLSEQEMLARGFNLKSDVLKVGHHGSYTSTSPPFLAAVSPRYAVIMVGKGNDYGHPHQETLQKLSAAGVQIYRTDLNGDITFNSDGSSLSVRTRRQ
jgi:competence protein ComEC